jgi:hypothetical protein
MMLRFLDLLTFTTEKIICKVLLIYLEPYEWINMENGGELNTEKTNSIDPMTLIIWGVLLVIYGVYTTYNTLNAGIETNLLYIITPNLILTFFGTLALLEGYKREKKVKKSG